MANEHYFEDKGERYGSSLLGLAVTKLFESTWVALTIAEFSSLQEKGVNVIAVGVGNKIFKGELIKIALGKEENVFQVSDFDKLSKDLLQPIIDMSCSTKNCE